MPALHGPAWITVSLALRRGRGTYHTGRFTKVPRLAKLLRVPTPADRASGQPWWPGTPAPATGSAGQALGPLLNPDPGTPDAAGRARREEHPPECWLSCAVKLKHGSDG
ncbi:hypothetical protein GCM10010339_88330 [Streptomyces alanosinicus]|uniref:Uncharacterized protein n=1 Tax=Streptomyces alanosinicus TaxID=68171 RepID=A0A919D993_9ACTN|nr:hypothetical protein GCM10010339_88330 [Streptomyces alanosinicus]